MTIKKSQASVEMLLAMSLVLAFFIFIVFFAQKEQRYINKWNVYLDEKRTCTKLGGVITKVFLMGDGSSMEMDISHNAKINFDAMHVDIMGESENTCITPVIYKIKTGSMELQKGRIKVTNDNNEVIVE